MFRSIVILISFTTLYGDNDIIIHRRFNGTSRDVFMGTDGCGSEQLLHSHQSMCICNETSNTFYEKAPGQYCTSL